MKLHCSIALLAILFIPLHAQAQIEGAFGLKLGETLNVDSDELKVIEGFGSSAYVITPPNPLRGFEDYIVYTIPVTHKIYQIKAFRRFDHVDGANEEMDTLARVLEGKYLTREERNNRRGRGSLSKNSPYSSQGTYGIKRDGNSVSISIYGGRDIAEVDRIMDNYPQPRVVITYRSKDYEQRKKEFREILRKRLENEKASGQSRADEAESVL